jgi:hypothetical protein
MTVEARRLEQRRLVLAAVDIGFIAKPTQEFSYVVLHEIRSEI